MFLIGEVTEVQSTTNFVKVKIYDYDNVEDPNYIPVMLSPIGAGQEGISSPLGIGDQVVIGFFDQERQNPFVLGKIHSSTEYIPNKKIKYGKFEIEFTESSIKFTSTTPFVDIDFGGVTLFDFLIAHTHVGNLGLPTPLTPDQITQLTNAKLNSTEIKFGS